MSQRDDFIPTAVRSYYFIIIGLGLSPGSIVGMKKSCDFSGFSSAPFELCAVKVYNLSITPPFWGGWLFFFVCVW